jgi:hypothetical protein
VRSCPVCHDNHLTAVWREILVCMQLYAAVVVAHAGLVGCAASFSMSCFSIVRCSQPHEPGVLTVHCSRELCSAVEHNLLRAKSSC